MINRIAIFTKALFTKEKRQPRGDLARKKLVQTRPEERKAIRAAKRQIPYLLDRMGRARSFEEMQWLTRALARSWAVVCWRIHERR